MGEWGNWFSLNPDAVENGSVEAASAVLYRIDLNPPTEFEPRLPKSILKGECETIPRICASKSIVKAIVGYNKAIADVLDGAGIPGKEYKLLALTTQGYFTPSKSLVPNANITDEKWIVNYNGSQPTVKGDTIGSLFITNTSISHGGVNDPLAKIKYTFYLNALTPIILNDTAVKEGYYSVVLEVSTRLAGAASDPPSGYKVLSCIEVTVDQYLQAKNRPLALENYY